MGWQAQAECMEEAGVNHYAAIPKNIKLSLVHADS